MTNNMDKDNEENFFKSPTIKERPNNNSSQGKNIEKENTSLSGIIL